MSMLDKLRYLPYRLNNFYWYSIKVWFKNIWKFRRELANTYPWDYSGLLLLMRRQIITMEECQRLHGNHVGADKVAKDLRIAIKLLDRLIEDDYDVQTGGEYTWIPCEVKGFTGCSEMICTKPREPKYIFPKGTSKQLYKHEENIRKQDIDMLMSYLKQYRKWWD